MQIKQRKGSKLTITIILSIQRKSSKFNMVLSIQSSKLTLILSIQRKSSKLTMTLSIQR